MSVSPASHGVTPAFLAELLRVVGPGGLLTQASELTVFECDGFTIEKNRPDVAVFPTTTEQVAEVVKLCNVWGIPFLPRGAGTSLAGGCLPVGGGVLLLLTRMRRIVEIDLENRRALVEAGVVNAWLTRELKATPYHYAPDPSSQGACTLGGNIATNSGGPHTLKYGVTVNHVLEVEAVLPDGTVTWLGGAALDLPGLDLVGTLVGSEGTLAIVTRAWVRLSLNPQGVRTLLAVFESVDAAAEAIAQIIGEGVVPAALELMDQGIIAAVEAAYQFGFPLDAAAVLLIELDGPEIGLDAERQIVEAWCHKCGAREVRIARDAAERQKLWKCRKQAFGAIGRLSPSYCTQDGVVPRTQLPEILRRIRTICDHYALQVVNVFHAGDGNIHPILLFDERDQEQTQRVLKASEAILSACLELGGSVTGEHGIGVEKLELMSRMFTPQDLSAMEQLRSAFNPRGLLSPGKLLPTAAGCGAEQRKPGRKAAV